MQNEFYHDNQHKKIKWDTLKKLGGQNLGDFYRQQLLKFHDSKNWK